MGEDDEEGDVLAVRALSRLSRIALFFIAYVSQVSAAPPDTLTLGETGIVATVVNGDTVVFSGRIAGSIRELDTRTLYTHFRFDDQPGVDVCEAIQLAANNTDRARTWHWFKNGKLFQLTLVDEMWVA